MSELDNYKVQLRRATSAQWTTTNVVLKNAEPAVETDTGKFKVGDGITSWAFLPYIGSEEEFINLVRDLGPAGGPFQFIGADVVTVDTLLSAILSLLALLSNIVEDKIVWPEGPGGGASLDGVPFVIMYVWDETEYVLANNGITIPPNASRTFVGLIDPIDEGYTMANGDQWLKIGDTL